MKFPLVAIVAAFRERRALASAEYPQYMRAGAFEVRKLSRNEQQRIVKNDWAQYQMWLQR